MTGFLSKVALTLAFLELAACGAAPAPPPAGTISAPHDNLNRLVDRYWDEQARPGNPLSPQFLADSLALERRFLADLLAVPRAGLDPQTRLSYDIFKRQRELNIEAFTYPSELMPVNPFDALPLQFARAAADMGRRSLGRAEDYAHWLQRIDDYADWTRQAIANMREGLRRGYTSPKVLMQRVLPLLQDLGADSPDNVFYTPLRSMPESIREPERSRLTQRVSSAVKDKLLPAYRQLHDFIQNDYLPRARTNIALSALPLGQSWYAARIRHTTGTALTANEIYRIGTAEVERLKARMPAGASDAEPDAAHPRLSAEELKQQTLAAMPALFADVPQDFVDIDAGTAPPADMQIAGYLQDVLPGRQYQASIQQRRTDLPKFRRYGSDPAFAEGWSLYAASLGEEMGLYRDDAAKRAALAAQLKCAAALVADTGIHAKDWTRAQAVDYLRTQLALDDAAAALMTDRIVALPAESLACKTGELKIQELRSAAQRALGPRFDIREFHSAILEDGAMPIDILEAKMKLWLEAPR